MATGAPPPIPTRSRRKRFRKVMRKVLLVLLLSGGWTASAEQSAPLRLSAGAVRDVELRGGGSHTYGVSLQAGDFLDAVAEQRGVDVETVLAAPEGVVVAHSDLPNSSH